MQQPHQKHNKKMVVIAAVAFAAATLKTKEVE
jgi:hypothetical protein